MNKLKDTGKHTHMEHKHRKRNVHTFFNTTQTDSSESDKNDDGADEYREG
jgi:hypothetical protein